MASDIDQLAPGPEVPTNPIKTSRLRVVTGWVLLVAGIWLLIAPPSKFFGAELNKDMAIFVGGILFAFSISLLVAQFENPQATLAGQLPWLGDKIGIHAKGYVLLFFVLVVLVNVFIFFLYDILKEERKSLSKQLEALKTINEHFNRLSDGKSIHDTLSTLLESGQTKDKLLASFLSFSSVPMRVSLICPSDPANADPRALVLTHTRKGFNLVPNPHVSKSRGNSTSDIIKIKGTSDHSISLYAKEPLIDESRILKLMIKREENDGTLATLIDLENWSLFGDLCKFKPVRSVEDEAVERSGPNAASDCVNNSGKQGVLVAGPDGKNTCDEG